MESVQILEKADIILSDNAAKKVSEIPPINWTSFLTKTGVQNDQKIHSLY